MENEGWKLECNYHIVSPDLATGDCCGSCRYKAHEDVEGVAICRNHKSVIYCAGLCSDYKSTNKND